MLKTIIWATDGSPTVKSEYPVVKDLAESSGGKLIVAHAGDMVSAADAGMFVDSTDALQAALEQIVEDLKDAGVDAELALMKTPMRNAAQSIADLARTAGADVVVVGNRGRGPLSAVFLGSFTSRLLQIAPCPVLVVPTGGRQQAA
jgi:nucleotide-binding universal stress UspA family protein